ncbi:uncharacterized protein [Gossypium hirsutum]|uniref:Uncharacterized protein n=1 Tax=Gossypium hirsutum TaxID=3635 RepID=A0ABM3AYJ6_GOSHI|nr:uncharacterized protein LOC121223027 [Gossypium hirsutum]XP_040959865.1 uncharacterized protein LOC121223028 [Gossypium hirsutum]
MVHPTAAVTPGFSKPPSRRRRRGQRPTAKKWFFLAFPSQGTRRLASLNPWDQKRSLVPQLSAPTTAKRAPTPGLQGDEVPVADSGGRGVRVEAWAGGVADEEAT